MRLIIALFALVAVVEAGYFPRLGLHTHCASQEACHFTTHSGRLGYLNTTTRFFDQVIDHFTFGPLPEGGDGLYKQRYLTYDKFYREGGPVFFYTGNEANVELYANATGLIWENAEEYGAYVVFAEHRYYGQSLPFGNEAFNHLRYLSSEQALADYAVLIRHIKGELVQDMKAPVIAFGGSYGGMLSSWFRMKYPGTVDGAIAASAPILAFADEDNAAKYWDSESYWSVVSQDASSCANLVRSTWPIFFEKAASTQGRAELSEMFEMCTPLKTEEEAKELAELYKYAYDTLAMGNYPYPSSYLTGGGPLLPAFPVREACQVFEETLKKETHGPKDRAMLLALRDSGAVFINATKDVKCMELPQDIEEDGIWDYLWCTENLPQETYFATDGVHDMFWKEPFNASFVQHRCMTNYNVSPRYMWMRAQYGGKQALPAASNIVFSNGLLDPWSSAGVRYNVSESVVAIEIALGAHHLDLMYSDPNDPPCVKEARKFELQHIDKWINQAKLQRY